ncbi:DUF397 domain-containing protein [Kitasatospora sp. CM 4170]|uniref:DUF397 domain-containing protein n=1 Tax=Kitasatospora aburaviensis TaxID=67265 RepID=A0ABW1F1U0_9ACTN|nr:DUF397 domain-containing protein [Kitasatospora sp. CM 4170]WNM46134.1 DUF397 domain-containing protein [Kitasatospora sp. CM 4170]
MSETTWQKSSFSGGDAENNCLELAASETGDLRHLRESDDPNVIVTTSAPKLRAFILGVKAGEFDHLV